MSVLEIDVEIGTTFAHWYIVIYNVIELIGKGVEVFNSTLFSSISSQC